MNALLVQSMLMIDTVLVAPLGQIPVAAMGIASAILAIALGVGLAIGNGIQLIVGRAFGSKLEDDLAIAFWVGLFINASVAVCFFCIIEFFGPRMLSTLTGNLDIQKLALGYLGITKYVILLTSFTQVCTAFYSGCGNTKVSLKGFLIEIPINAILSYLLIYGVGDYGGLGLEGAAWGSLSAVFLRAIYFYGVVKVDRRVDLTYPIERPFATEIRSQLSEISPIAANFFVLFIGASIYQLLYAQLKLSSFVAITLIFPWMRIGTQLVSSWSQASAISISQALGSNDRHHLNNFVSICTRTALGLSVVVAVFFFLLSQFIHLIYPNISIETSADLKAIAPLYILLPIIRGYNSVSGNILRALGDSNRILKLHLITQWMIALPLCALLVLYYQVSIFWAFAVMLIEEVLKTYHFYQYTQEKLSQTNGVAY